MPEQFPTYGRRPEEPDTFITDKTRAIVMEDYAQDPRRTELSHGLIDVAATNLYQGAKTAGVNAGRLSVVGLSRQVEAGTPAPKGDVYDGSTSNSEHTTDQELTREEGVFREKLFEGLTASYATYQTVVKVLNADPDRTSVIGTMPEENAKELAKQRLTPAVVRELYAQTKEAELHPIGNSPAAGYDVIFIPNVTLTEQDEGNLATAIQRAVPAYKDKPYKFDPLHNAPHQATGEDSVRVVFVPRHLTLQGTAAEQYDAMKTHNNKEWATILRSADDFEAMVATLHIILTNPDGIDWEKPVYNVKRFWATYYRKVGAMLGVDGDAPDSSCSATASSSVTPRSP